MKKTLLIIALAILPLSARADQNETEFLKRAVAAIESQRNNALTAAAVAEARLGQVQSDLEKANIRIKELETRDK